MVIRGLLLVIIFALNTSCLTTKNGKFWKVKDATDDFEGHVLYFSNHDLDETNSTFTRAVFVIHGSGGNSIGAYNSMVSTSRSAGAQNTTLVVAPTWLQGDNKVLTPLLFSKPNVLFWASGWRGGVSSTDSKKNPRSFRLSNFEVLDSMLARVGDANFFPNIDAVIVAGHSAGGQFVNRYAATNRQHATLASQVSTVRYIVSNPSSFAYFNNQRRVAGTLDTFEVPSTTCDGYNTWHYGLDNISTTNYPYIIASGTDNFGGNYDARGVVHLMGGNDNDPNASQLDAGCGAALQGDHRLERAKVYYNHLRTFVTSGDPIMAIISGVGHSSSGIYSSSCGLRYIFDTSASCTLESGAITSFRSETNPAK